MRSPYQCSHKARQLPPLSRRCVVGAMVAFTAALSSCAPAVRTPVAAVTPTATPTSTPAPTATVLRLLDISPKDGSRVDSTTIMVARLSYYIPDFDPERTYAVSTLFAQVGGRLSSVGTQTVPLQAPVGIVTIRGPVLPSNSRIPSEPVSPLTGVFYLLGSDSIVGAPDTVRQGNVMRVRTGSQSSVQARSRTFYFNGAGPARSLATGLPVALEQYWTYKQHKAFAVAYESSTRWTSGYAFGARSEDAAIERALAHCKASAERRQITAPCQLVASNDESAR